jgi:hypothetical protein
MDPMDPMDPSRADYLENKIKTQAGQAKRGDDQKGRKNKNFSVCLI